MALKSMTGFARLSGSLTPAQKSQPESQQNTPYPAWVVELRSVNGKGLDLRLRLPPGLEAIEQEIKKTLSNQLGRGNVSLSLNLTNLQDQGRLELNETAFNQLLAIAKRAHELSGLPLPDLNTLLQNKTVLKETEATKDEAAINQLHQAILTDITACTSQLSQARREEGKALGHILTEKLEIINQLVKEATNAAEAQKDGLKSKLKSAMEKLMEEAATWDESRLHQEAMLLIVKADVSEELDRLRAHISQARDLMERDEPVGRRLDFLCQEFNREANTLCSKAASKELTYIGLELKTIIDQLREQVQNIE